jgi:hypothetical protein
LWLTRKKLFDEASSLLFVTLSTGKSQIADSIRTATSLGQDVLDLKRDVLISAVGTLSPPLLQQVLAYLVTLKHPLLVLYSGNRRVLHDLHIESDSLNRDRRDGTPASKP